MPTHILKQCMDNSILFNFLKTICVVEHSQYVVNYDSLKKAKFTEIIDTFIDEIRPYYYLSKRSYLDEPLTYKRFLTIIRQICKHNHILYRSSLKYQYSEQRMEYYVYFGEEAEFDDTISDPEPPPPTGIIDNTHCEKLTSGGEDDDEVA